MTTEELLKLLPNCRVVSTVKQEEDEGAWLAVRSKGVGGSDIGAICGVSPFSTAKQIYFKKTGMFEDEMKPNDASKERMHFGHVLEPIVANEYVRRTGRKVVDINCTLCHKDYPWALANIDRLIVEEIVTEDGVIIEMPVGILECKTTGEYNNDEWDEGTILESYMYQLNWYMWILDLPKGAFACLVGGNKFYEYEVFRNDELLQETMIPQGDYFWNTCIKGLIEPIMQHGDTDLAKTIFADCIKGSMVPMDSVHDELAAIIIERKAQIKALTAEQEEAENRIKDLLKTAEIGTGTDYVVKWSPRSQSRVDTDLFKMNYPAIYDAVKKQINYRVLSVKAL